MTDEQTAHEVARLIVAYRAFDEQNRGTRTGVGFVGRTAWEHLDSLVGYDTPEERSRWHRVANRAADLVLDGDMGSGRRQVLKGATGKRSKAA